jgi:hypothetical protein
LIGQASVEKNSLPSDPPSYQIQRGRRLLLRLKWILDSQRFIIRFLNRSKNTISREVVFRLLLHVLAMASSETAAYPRHEDYALYRRVILDVLLSAFHLLMLIDSKVTMDEQDILRSNLENMLQRWRDVSELSPMENNLLGDITIASIEDMEDMPSLTHHNFDSFVILSEGFIQ